MKPGCFLKTVMAQIVHHRTDGHPKDLVLDVVEHLFKSN